MHAGISHSDAVSVTEEAVYLKKRPNKGAGILLTSDSTGSKTISIALLVLSIPNTFATRAITYTTLTNNNNNNNNKTTLFSNYSIY